MKCVLLFYIFASIAGVSFAPPHPYPLEFIVHAWSSCPDGRHCSLKPFEACMELMYYPQVCDSRNITTVVQGNCSQAGNYSNNTIVTLQADGSDLPFAYYILNFNSSNPMLPILKQGMVTMAGASTIVETHGGCKTNITVVPGGSGDICDEGLLVSRCH